MLSLKDQREIAMSAIAHTIETFRERCNERVLQSEGDAPSDIFNLGQGFAPASRIDSVKVVFWLLEDN